MAGKTACGSFGELPPNWDTEVRFYSGVKSCSGITGFDSCPKEWLSILDAENN